MTDAEHWDRLYTSRDEADVGWYERVPTTLDDVLDASADDTDAVIVDVGAGASRLVDELLERGYENVTLVDLSQAACGRVRDRLKESGLGMPTTIVADASSLDFDGAVDVWHDRAVFHFLTDADARRAYVDAAHRSLGPSGAVVVAAFGPDGPESCAGLPVRRYDADELTAAFADGFRSEGCRHHQPDPSADDRRPYTICRFRKNGDRDVRPVS